MIDRLRQQIQDRLDQLLAEAEKLRDALVALNPRANASSAKTKVPAPARTASSARPRRAPGSASPGSARARTSPRRAPAARGETKRAVLGALSDGNAMTAGEVAAATGLARATVSTTLTKLAKTGEVLKAERGYQLPRPAGSTDATAAGG